LKKILMATMKHKYLLRNYFTEVNALIQ
jgi:hypothetical protein